MKYYQIGIRTLAVFGILGVVAGLLFGLDTFSFSLGCFIAAAVLYPQIGQSVLAWKEAVEMAKDKWVVKQPIFVSENMKFVIVTLHPMSEPEVTRVLKVYGGHSDWERFCKLKQDMTLAFSAQDKDKPLDTKGEISSFLEIHQTYPAGHRFAK